MALEQRISVKMSQRLVMTPSLQQAIKLLQMSKLDLVEEVQQELLENPILEEGQVEAQGDAPNEQDEEPPSPLDDVDLDSYFQDVEGFIPRTPTDTGAELRTFEASLAEPTNLADHLEWQLDMSSATPLQKEIGRAIIGNLNDDGYLRATLDEIQRMGDYDRDTVADTLRMVQGFDPIGVGSRDLVECLCVQLEHLGESGTVAETIVRFHLDKLQARKYKELAEAVAVDMEDLQAEVEIIRGLDPRPGLKYSVDRNSYVVPDVYVVKIDDEYQIILNEDGLPRLRISPVYRRMISRSGGQAASSEAKEYVRNKLRSAMRLIKSLEERQRTIFKVATSIVKFQRGFLDNGIEHMRPLVLKDVAEDIGMHESTVSRVVNNKYMHTHRGLYEMRFFFHSGIESSDGNGAVSSLSVKNRIRKIIGAEEPRKPYSDAAIVKILVADGLKIARRTVAKYREELKIPSSSMRKGSVL